MGYDSYLWSDNSTDSNIIVTESAVYCVTVTDEVGCTAEACVEVIANPSSSSMIDEFVCFGDSIEIAGEVFTETGNHEIILPGANVEGCDSTIYLDLTVNSQIELQNSVETVDDGSGSGAIEIAIDGGTPPYQADWDNGQSGLMISNLNYGDYVVVITDDSGCTAEFSFTIALETAVRDFQNDAFLCTISPNPFSTTTHLSFGLQSLSQVRVDVLNVRGQIIENLFLGDQIPGIHTSEWNAEDQPEGLYFFKITVNGNVFVKKIVLAR